jgi:hypothetical protein
MSCECPRHNEHVKDFIRKYPGADGKFGIVDVEPGGCQLRSSRKEYGSLLPVVLRIGGY